MQDAVPVGEGAMAALLGLDLDEARAVALEAAQGEVCEAANDNAPGQVVVSGTRAAVERAVAVAGERGGRKSILLPVSAPFHCALMAPVAEVMIDALAAAALQTPSVPVVSNVTAGPVSDVEEIRRLLVEQVTAMVRWRESVLYMKEHGVEELVEIGVGTVLTGLARRIDSELSRVAVGTPDGIEILSRYALIPRFGKLANHGGTLMFDLSGRSALVTGASGGIGGAVARALNARGAAVALSDVRPKGLEQLAAELGERVHVIPCDLGDAAATDALAKDAEAALGGIDILINNAGLTRDNLLLRMKDEDWQRILDINLTAAFRLTRACLRGMMKRRWGRIIGLASVVGVTGNPGQANYSASKAALIGMTKSLAREVASRGITANCVAPGFIATPMTEGLGEDVKARLVAQIPGGRLGTADEIAAAIVFLASDEAAYITGQTLHVNGGMAMI